MQAQKTAWRDLEIRMAGMAKMNVARTDQRSCEDGTVEVKQWLKMQDVDDGAVLLIRRKMRG